MNYNEQRGIIRERFKTEVYSLIERGNKRKFQSKKAYCETAGHTTQALNAFETREDAVPSTQLLYGLLIASKNTINLNELFLGKTLNQSKDGYIGDFKLPKDAILTDKATVEEMEAMIEFLYNKVKRIKET